MIKLQIANFKSKKIGVLMGGMSTERGISLRSGQAVYDALIQKGYNVIKIDVGKDVYEQLTKEKIDMAFIALHGKYGEDGAIQGLLEIIGVPYTGSGIMSSAVCANKVVAKKFFMLNKIPTPAFMSLGVKGLKNMGVESFISMFKAPGSHLIVKPNSQGSTIGVTVVKNKSDLAKAVKKALRYDDTVLIERFVKGRELTVGILNGRTLPVIEIRPKGGIYDFKAKYTKGMTEYIAPAPLPKTLEKKVNSIALKAFDSLGCRGAARVDIMLDYKNRPYVLEVNTIPGMTEMSLLPKAALCAGISFPEMVEEILMGGIKHFRGKGMA
ncbi:MAG: D-alanine--D-alanine ligase [Deltaproteobacteria bacterium]|nr:D-alanine--D-alanine ligase [Deltaproteobacteria bacterium]